MYDRCEQRHEPPLATATWVSTRVHHSDESDGRVKRVGNDPYDYTGSSSDRHWPVPTGAEGIVYDERELQDAEEHSCPSLLLLEPLFLGLPEILPLS